MSRVRGFEKISKEQFEKDFKMLFIDYEDIVLPKRATKKSAGYDIPAPFKICLLPGEDIKVPTGLRAFMLDDERMEMLPRSGHGFKYLRLANTEALIDSDYYYSDNEGHFWVKIRNEGDKEIVIKKGEGMCQAIFSKYLLTDGDSFENGEIRNGGFGSTTRM